MAKGKPNEIRLVRVYNAPVKLVWECYTDDKHKASWWGPRGFTITTKSKDVRPGGTWVYTMHGPDGKDWPNYTTYHVVDKYTKLVYDHGASAADQNPLFRVTVTFEEFKGKTVMDMTMSLESEAAAKEISKFIKQASGNSTWDRLGEYLEEKSSGKDSFIINRTFEAPLATVFEMWSNPKHLTKWLPPTGFRMEYIKADVRTGGTSFYSMSNGETTMYGKAEYLDISPVHFMSYIQHFTDKNGNLGHHPMAPTWPPYMYTGVTFAEESPNETRVTLTTVVHGDATQAERDIFNLAKAGMTMGWSGSFDKLDEVLNQ